MDSEVTLTYNSIDYPTVVIIWSFIILIMIALVCWYTLSEHKEFVVFHMPFTKNKRKKQRELLLQQQQQQQKQRKQRQKQRQKQQQQQQPNPIDFEIQYHPDSSSLLKNRSFTLQTPQKYKRKTKSNRTNTLPGSPEKKAIIHEIETKSNRTNTSPSSPKKKQKEKRKQKKKQRQEFAYNFFISTLETLLTKPIQYIHKKNKCTNTNEFTVGGAAVTFLESLYTKPANDPKNEIVLLKNYLKEGNEDDTLYKLYRFVYAIHRNSDCILPNNEPTLKNFADNIVIPNNDDQTKMNDDFIQFIIDMAMLSLNKPILFTNMGDIFWKTLCTMVYKNKYKYIWKQSVNITNETDLLSFFEMILKDSGQYKNITNVNFNKAIRIDLQNWFRYEWEERGKVENYQGHGVIGRQLYEYRKRLSKYNVSTQIV